MRRVKKAKKGALEKKKKRRRSPLRRMAEADDKAGTGEEDFEAGMRQNAMERDAADADNDGKLDFKEFCYFVREREAGEFTEKELKKRFEALDEDGSGKVDMPSTCSGRSRTRLRVRRSVLSTSSARGTRTARAPSTSGVLQGGPLARL